MKRMSWLVGRAGERQCTPGHCLYCQEKIGNGEHKAGCSIRRKTVVVRATIDLVVDVPEDWSGKDVASHRNEGSWCASNVLADMQNLSQRVGCLCNFITVAFLRDATPADERSQQIFVSSLPS